MLDESYFENRSLVNFSPTLREPSRRRRRRRKRQQQLQAISLDKYWNSLYHSLNVPLTWNRDDILCLSWMYDMIRTEWFVWKTSYVKKSNQNTNKQSATCWALYIPEPTDRKILFWVPSSISRPHLGDDNDTQLIDNFYTHIPSYFSAGETIDLPNFFDWATIDPHRPNISPLKPGGIPPFSFQLQTPSRLKWISLILKVTKKTATCKNISKMRSDELFRNFCEEKRWNKATKYDH